MIQYKEHKNIDKAKWDECIRQSENGNVFNTSWYLDVVTENSWDALVEGDYESIMPLPISKKAGVKILYLPFFMRETDVFGAGKERLSFLKKALEQFKLVQMGFSANMEESIRSLDVAHQCMHYQRLKLYQDYTAIRADYSKNAKRMVNKAEKAGYGLRDMESGASIVDLFLKTKGEEISELKKQDFSRLKQLMKRALQEDCGRAVGVFEGDEVVAGGFYLHYKNTITYLKGAILPRARKAGAGYWYMDTIIRENAGKDKILDFGGSNVKGVADFYKKFGANDAFYLFLEQNELPVWLKAARKIKNKLRLNRDLKNTRILLTGASGGLGKIIAKGLLELGAQMALHCKENEKELEALIKEANAEDRAFVVKGDLRSETNIEWIVQLASVEMGRVDVLINNAGISSSGMSWKLDLEEWNKTLEVNLTGTFLMTKHVLPEMRKNNYGRIINISSVVANTGFIGTSAYAASKAGVIGFTKSVAKENANKNITVNCIAPGYFSEGMIHEVPEEVQEELLASIPKNKFGDPQNLLQSILYLCSEKSDYITGETININGGLYS